MKKVLITGAAGYLGYHIVDLLIKKNYFIYAYDKFYFKNENIFKNFNNIEVIKGDSRSIDEKYFKNIYAVIDLVNIGISPIGDRFFDKVSWDINYNSRVRTCRLAKKHNVKHYIYPSSCSVYGLRKDLKLVNEKSRIDPKSVYAKTKLALEKKTKNLSNKNFIVTGLRLPTLFGYSKKMRNDLIINYFAGYIKKYNKINLQGDGKQGRPFLHVIDAAKAFIYFLEYKKKDKINNKIINIGTEKNNIILLDLAKKIFNLFKIKPKINYYGILDNRSYFVDFSLSRKLGFKCSKTIQNGITELKKNKLFFTKFDNEYNYPKKIFKRYKAKEQNLGKIKSYDYSLLKYKKLNNKPKKKILVILGSDKFNLNLIQKLYNLVCKNLNNFDFVINNDDKKRINFKKKKYKIFSSFNKINQKNLRDDYDVLINLWGAKIFTKEELSYFEKKINLHPSYLPSWRGKNSSYYANLNQIGNGASIIEMDENIDTPNIYVRKKINAKYNETGFQTYLKSVNLCLNLFNKHIRSILNGKIKFKKIKYLKRNFRIYYKKEFIKDYVIKLKEKDEISKFIRLCLALDFPKNKLKILVNKQKFYLTLQLKKDKI